MRQAPPRLQELIVPLVEGLGFELVGIEFQPQGGRGLLRIYIDAPAGIVVEDCEKVSYQVSGMLDVEDPIPGEYTLEVSSPGIDRPLFKLEDFRRFAGHRARLQLARAIDGRARFSGILRGVDDAERVALEVDGEALSFAFEEIDRARLVGEVRPGARNAGVTGR